MVKGLDILKETCDFICDNADDLVEVEIQPEIGSLTHCKLYVHINGVTVLRICKMEKAQVRVYTDAIRSKILG